MLFSAVIAGRDCELVSCVGTVPASSSSPDAVTSRVDTNSRDAHCSVRPQPAAGSRRYNVPRQTDSRPPTYHGQLELVKHLLSGFI